MAIGRLQVMPADQGVEPMRVVLGKEGPRQPDCAQDVGTEPVAAAAKLGFDEAVVEARVVGDKNPTCEQFGDGRQELGKHGAPRTMSLVMPVSAWMSDGIGTPGSTSDDHS